MIDSGTPYPELAREVTKGGVARKLYKMGYFDGAISATIIAIIVGAFVL